ncbi:MAG: aminotransferase class V-fold PLP-dependent enzyme [Phycisphaerales bacterium]|nr:aminotransferase class V-fold PLP-dependent enzyme [Phycisphaerales bacterium]
MPTSRPGFGESVRGDWPLDFSVAFLNHGSFGSVPHEIHKVAEQWRARFEAEPIEWFSRRSGDAVREAASKVASFLGSPADRTGFVVNATAAVNAVLRDAAIGRDDDILGLDHGYGAVKKAIRHLASARGANVIEARIPLPVHGPEDIIQAVEDAITPRTRLAVIDQVTSPTALVIPVQAIVDLCRARGIPVLIDGAHAPGMLHRPADIEGAGWWTGNLHKWVCAPKGCAVLVTSEEQLPRTHPPVISHGYQSSFAEEFDWQGTMDFAPWLSAPASIDFWDRYGGMELVRDHNHELVTSAHRFLVQRLGLAPISPIDGSLLGSMATIPLPRILESHPQRSTIEALNARLNHEFQVEAPVMDVGGTWHVRISAQVYNEPADYERLASAIESLVGECC